MELHLLKNSETLQSAMLLRTFLLILVLHCEAFAVLNQYCVNRRYAFSDFELKCPTSGVSIDEKHVKPPVVNEREKREKSYYWIPDSLQTLIDLEWGLYPHVKNLYHEQRSLNTGTFQEQFDSANAHVLAYLRDFESSTIQVIKVLGNSSEEQIEQSKILLGNPLAIYKLIQRFCTYVRNWKGRMISPGVALDLGRILKIWDLPIHCQIDLRLSMESIVAIHYFHDLAAKEIARGNVLGTSTGGTLNARDCLQIGQYAVGKAWYRTGFQWLEHALYLVQNTTDPSVNRVDVLDALLKAEFSHDTDYAKQTFLDYSKYFSKPKVLEHTKSHAVVQQRFETINQQEEYLLGVAFRGICQGKISQIEEEKSKLFCWYEDAVHPSFKIGPLKAEFHALFPKTEVVQYYDVIGEKTLEIMKKLPDIYGPSNVSYTSSEGMKRFVQLVNKFGKDKEALAAINSLKVIERVTGLKDRTAARYHFRPMLQRPGTFYKAHLDGEVFIDGLGTFLLYMSDVEKGGETIFFDSGLKITPRKGSALMFYNLFSCGQNDRSTWHGYCPVVFGEKWVSPEWISYDRQSHLQCHRKPNTPYEILVNGKSKYTSQTNYQSQGT